MAHMDEAVSNDIPKDIQIALVDKAHHDVQQLITYAVDAVMTHINHQLRHGTHIPIAPGMTAMNIHIENIPIQDAQLYEEIVYSLATKRAAHLLEVSAN